MVKEMTRIKDVLEVLDARLDRMELKTEMYIAAELGRRKAHKATIAALGAVGAAAVEIMIAVAKHIFH
jgi:hypothetical protein